MMYVKGGLFRVILLLDLTSTDGQHSTFSHPTERINKDKDEIIPNQLVETVFTSIFMCEVSV